MATETIKIQRKELDNGKRAIILQINGQEGILASELTGLLNVTRSTIHQLIKSHALSSVSMTTQTRTTLRNEKVIPITGRTSHFLPKETVETLIKLINTPEAWSINHQLWLESARASQLDLENQDLRANASKLADYVHLLISKLNEAERTKAWIGSKREATAMNTAAQAMRRYRVLEDAYVDARIRLQELDSWKTVIGWQNIYPELKAKNPQQLSRELGKLAKARGIERKTTPSERFGQEYLYPDYLVEDYVRMTASQTY